MISSATKRGDEVSVRSAGYTLSLHFVPTLRRLRFVAHFVVHCSRWEFLLDLKAIERTLRHLGLWRQGVRVSPARAPPETAEWVTDLPYVLRDRVLYDPQVKTLIFRGVEVYREQPAGSPLTLPNAWIKLPVNNTELKYPLFSATIGSAYSGVMLQAGALIGENRRGFLERDPMLTRVLFGFRIVPRESHAVHNANVLLLALRINKQPSAAQKTDFFSVAFRWGGRL